MTLQLFGHPFSSYTWKALIPIYADGTEFQFRQVPENDENYSELKRIWPFGKFPVLVDDGQVIAEATCIIEHLQAHHPGPNVWIPEGELGRRVRFLDRFFDLHVQGNMQPSVNHALRPEGKGTDMEFRHEQFFDQAARDGHERGWTVTFGKLEAFLAQG